jgi:hypothetical protein
MSNPPPSTKIEEYLAAVQTWTAKQGFTPQALAHGAGLDPDSLKCMLADDWNPRYETLCAIERFIRRYTECLRIQAGTERLGKTMSWTPDSEAV